MAKAQKAYFGLGRLISIIIAIIPGLSWICGIIQTLMEGKLINAVLRIIFGLWIVYILDIIWILWKGELCHVWILW